MKSKFTKIVFFAVFAVSLLLNGIVIVFVASNNANTSFISCKTPGNYYSGAQIVSVPETVPASRTVEFGAVSVVLFEGDTAYLQYSVVSTGRRSPERQINYQNQYLYDGNIVNVENDLYGAKITALKEGEVLLQVFSNNGFSNVANITVLPGKFLEKKPDEKNDEN
jgi:hypothetical protein